MTNKELVDRTKETILDQFDYLINGEGLDAEQAIEELRYSEINFAGADPISLSDVEFVNYCKKIVTKYANKKLEVTDGVQIEDKDVYVVWLTKALQNNKALLSTNLLDGMYYEVTFNGNKAEFYLDAYKKFENQAYALEMLK